MVKNLKHFALMVATGHPDYVKIGEKMGYATSELSARTEGLMKLLKILDIVQKLKLTPFMISKISANPIFGWNIILASPFTLWDINIVCDRLELTFEVFKKLEKKWKLNKLKPNYRHTILLRQVFQIATARKLLPTEHPYLEMEAYRRSCYFEDTYHLIQKSRRSGTPITEAMIVEIEKKYGRWSQNDCISILLAHTNSEDNLKIRNVEGKHSIYTPSEELYQIMDSVADISSMGYCKYIHNRDICWTKIFYSPLYEKFLAHPNFIPFMDMFCLRRKWWGFLLDQEKYTPGNFMKLLRDPVLGKELERYNYESQTPFILSIMSMEVLLTEFHHLSVDWMKVVKRYPKTPDKLPLLIETLAKKKIKNALGYLAAHTCITPEIFVENVKYLLPCPQISANPNFYPHLIEALQYCQGKPKKFPEDTFFGKHYLEYSGGRKRYYYVSFKFLNCNPALRVKDIEAFPHLSWRWELINRNISCQEILDNPTPKHAWNWNQIVHRDDFWKTDIWKSKAICNETQMVNYSTKFKLEYIKHVEEKKLFPSYTTTLPTSIFARRFGKYYDRGIKLAHKLKSQIAYFDEREYAATILQYHWKNTRMFNQLLQVYNYEISYLIWLSLGPL